MLRSLVGSEMCIRDRYQRRVRGAQTSTMSKEVMMSMRMPPEAPAAATAAPSRNAASSGADAYSSNYKGVMLCDRPGIQVDRTAPQGMNPDPFISAVNAPEQLGLNPIKKAALHAGGDKRTKPKNSALTNHKRWLRSLHLLKVELEEEEAWQAQAEAEQKAKLAAESQKVRDHIRQVKRNMAGIDDIQGVNTAQQVLSKEDMLSELKSKLNRDLVEELHERVDDKKPPVPTPPPATAPSKSAQGSKPAWARTAEENEEEEEMEVEDLLAFAEELNIDDYMHDCEFRDALAAAKARIHELESEDEAEDGDDVATQCTERTMGSVGSVRSSMSEALRAKEAKEANGEHEWDGSVCSDAQSKKSRTSRLSRAVAEELLEMNPNLRQKHSARSLAEVVEKKGYLQQSGNQNQPGFDPTNHEKFGRCGAGAVKVAVHNEENRLHRQEGKEAKDLPYLYRNPAV
eukprot:TRINITY_DN3157_c0_g2_i1.p1 TRINITY_DN3157_c0_g2~~TRINITY_DN3157_c0_g2_i1.p1  ORF type:complete len:458 (-),score=147.91 TRINITY_DN3157_c0_g2_i1:273-1646(-)